MTGSAQGVIWGSEACWGTGKGQGVQEHNFVKHPLKRGVRGAVGAGSTARRDFRGLTLDELANIRPGPQYATSLEQRPERSEKPEHQTKSEDVWDAGGRDTRRRVGQGVLGSV